MGQSFSFASGRGARLVCAPLFFALLALSARPAVGQIPAQTPAPVRTGGATYRILDAGTPIGVATSSVETDADGWVIRGTSFLGGKYGLTVRRFEAHYDTLWRARFVTMDLATPKETLLVHAAINDGATRTEIIHDGSVDIGTHTVSVDTIVLPDSVFTAYEALAARLAIARTGTTLPVFVLPLGEIRVRLDSVTLERLPTRAGPLAARHWKLVFLTGTRESPAEVWEAGGRLVRVDMLADQISVIRSDITP